MLQPYMRRSPAGPSRWCVLRDWIGEGQRFAVIGNNGTGRIPGAEDQALLVEIFRSRGNGAGCTAADATHRQGIGEALLSYQLADGMALVVVSVEELIARCSREHCRELPGQIVDVLHASVEPETAGGWHLMGGVTGNKDAPTPIRGRNVGRCGPWNDAEDFDVEIGDPDRKPNEIGRALRGEILHMIPVAR